MRSSANAPEGAVPPNRRQATQAPTVPDPVHDFNVNEFLLHIGYSTNSEEMYCTSAGGGSAAAGSNPNAIEINQDLPISEQ